MARPEKKVSAERDLGDLPDKEEEMLPRNAEQVPQESTGDEIPDTAGEHGRMAPEAARGIEKREE